MQKITPFLWFNDNAEEAMQFYMSVFPDASIEKVVRYGEAGPGPAGSVMTAVFKLFGQEYIALNGGPKFSFTEAVSFVINCETQEEVDHYWNQLSEGGIRSRCGWLKDRFGLSWQVVPTALSRLLSAGTAAQKGRVMQAMMKMEKLVIAALEEAAEVKPPAAA
jgi:predicted 3-demethylubiquinone-9 3-methyltransferase (glyoxalase superfamily)